MKHLRPKVLKPVLPNVGIEMAYRRKLDELIKEMFKSVEYWVLAKYRNNAPEMAMDEDHEFQVVDSWNVPEGFTGIAHGPYGVSRNTWFPYLNGKIIQGAKGRGRSFATEEAAVAALRAEMIEPAAVLTMSIKQLADRWLKKFDEAAEKMADYFTDEVSERTDARMKRILRDGGISVPFEMTPAQKDIAEATVRANVALIKSIPSQFFTNIEGMVMRSVQRGGDAGQLASDLQREFGVTKRRAALISRDQNNKATSAFVRARQIEFGLTEAIWMHSHAGKEPRPTHVKMNGKKYDVTKGMYDPAEKRFIFPGELINCRCTSKTIVAGLS